MSRLAPLLVLAATLWSAAATAQSVPACQAPGMPAAVVQVVQWKAQEGRADEVAGILQELGRLSRAEPGIRAFITHRSPTEPSDFFIYELYADQAALQAHLETAHFKELVLGRAIPLLAQRVRTITALQPCG